MNRILLFLMLAASAVLAVGGTREARAGYYPSLFTGTRANAMGGAFVAIADDEEAIFMNPAGLAGVKGFTFNYAAWDVEVSTDTIYTGLQGMTAFNNISPSTLNMLMGKDIYSHSQITPSFIMPHFGFSLISDQQFSLLQQNTANPVMGIQYQSTNGFQFAYGTSVLPKRLRSRSDLRIGLAGKILWRMGGFYNLNTLQIIDLTQDPIDSLHAITGSYGLGYGADMGTQYIYHLTKTFSLSTAMVMTDIGNTAFASAAQPQHSNLTWGFAASYKLKRIKFNYAFDYQHILEDVDFRSRTHTGIEAQFPFISLMAGLNQMNLSYGFSFDVWILRITAAYYGEELASYGGQNTEDRYALRIATKIGF